jgi:hypothetical protein
MTAIKNLAIFTVTLETFVITYIVYGLARPWFTEDLWDNFAHGIQYGVCILVSGLVFWAMMRKFR